MVKQIFGENTDYSADRIELIVMTDQDSRSRTCEAQLIDNEGDRWLVTYRIGQSATNASELIVRAEWQFLGSS